MILGFLGKGGSGKSTISTQMALFLRDQGKTILAIDADHNMDLSYNLSAGELPPMRYLSESLPDLKQYLALSNTDTYASAFLKGTETRFSLSPKDPVTATYTVRIQEGIDLMTAGPQNDTVLYGKSCSHSLTSPLKLYLPLLELAENEMVIVDEKAGADGVTTGIVTGIDAGVIVCEPALHSIKTAKQIAELMNFYGTPYIFVGNKIESSEDKEFIEKELGVAPTTFFMQSTGVKRDPSLRIAEWGDELSGVVTATHSLHKNDRLERTKIKFARNQEFARH